MKTYHAALGIIATIAFVSCETTETYPISTTSVHELQQSYASETAPLGNVNVKCSVFDGTETIQLPDFTIRPGAPTTAENIQEGIFPTAYDLPSFETAAQPTDGIFPVTPAVPKDFRTVNLGWSVNASISLANGYAIASGELTERRVGNLLRAQGAPFRPITATGTDVLGKPVPVTLTDNDILFPTIHTSEYPLVVAFKPGTSESFRIYLDEEKVRYADFSIAPDA